MNPMQWIATLITDALRDPVDGTKLHDARVMCEGTPHGDTFTLLINGEHVHSESADPRDAMSDRGIQDFADQLADRMYEAAQDYLHRQLTPEPEDHSAIDRAKARAHAELGA